MDFKLVIVVLFAYFIRPQDWLPGMAGTNIMKPLMAVTLVAMVTRRRGFSVGSLIKTPADWAMLAYAIYIVAAAPAGQRPFGEVVVFVAYYFVTSQALSTPGRLTLYLRCWLGALLVVAVLAVASEFGLDLTGARELTHAVPGKPRLALNTYLFNNPNSLGHSVVIAIPLAYFLLFWRKPVRHKLLAAAAVLLAGGCVYLTQSKGAFLVGFAVMVLSMIFGRPLLFQLIALALAVTLGIEGLSKLPRMTDIDRARQDEAIMGRMLAWEQARAASKESPGGTGFKNFKAIIEFEKEEVFKATHSSYVLVGAELGRNGMFFYLAVLYASLRILGTARCRREEDEASRRAMVVILLGYLGSGWLIDRSYHLEYFLLAGAVSAFHRRLGIEAGLVDPAGEVEPSEYDGRQTAADPAAADDGSIASDAADTIRTPAEVDTSEVAEEAVEQELTRFWYWRRFGAIDLLLVALFTKVVFDVWDHLLRIYFL